LLDILALANEITLRAEGRDRFLIGIAGPPGAGKSTLAESLVRTLPDSAAVPMDGFHYDNAVLNELGLRAHKGAPETFDYAGFAVTLRRIRLREPNIAIPVFDRQMDLAKAGAALIGQAIKYVVVEGNYLLLEEDPWSELADLFDLTIFLDPPRAELERRLLRRWTDLGDSDEKAWYWVATNDMPNVDRVLARRGSAHLTLS
jgi:pantothenate kinase